jgi:hypothetical protein
MRLNFTQKCRLLGGAIMFALGMPGLAVAQTNIAPGGTVTQNFDGMDATSPTAALPTNWKVSKSSTEREVTSFATAVAVTDRIGGNGINSSAGNGIYNFGDGTTSSDRAVGGLSSTSASKSVNVYTSLHNNGTAGINDFTVSFAVEKYRTGSNPSPFRIQLYYSTDGTNWTNAGVNFAVTFAPDVATNGYTTAPGVTGSVTNQTLSVPLALGSDLYLAWNYSVSAGSTTSNSQALGVDNISITANGGAVVNNPVPTLASISPTTAVANSGSFTLTVTGTNFINGSVINFNSTAKSTTYVSATTLTATISNSDIAAAGTVPVTVTNSAPGGGTTSAVNFTVTQPATALSIVAGGSVTQDFSSLSTSATASTPFGWYVSKDNSNARTVGAFSGATSTTEFRAGNSLTSGTGGIYNFGAGDGATATDRALGGLSSSSNGKSVNIYSHLENTGTTNIAAFSISYDVEKYRNGTNPAGYRVQLFYSTNGTTWTDAGNDFTTTFAADADNLGFTSAPGGTVPVTSKLLMVPVNAGNQIYLAWNYSVVSGSTSSNAPGLGLDNISITALTTNPVPVITSISPNNATAGSSNFTLTVNGTDFVSNATVNFNGVAKTTTFVSATQLTAAISSTDIAAAGTIPVTVTNPAPGGGTSNSVNFTVNAAVTPTVSVSGTLTAFSTTVGTPSAPQSYQVSGTALTDDITVTAPTGFQVSLTAVSGYASGLTLNQTSGSVAQTTVYVRFNPSVSGSVSGNVTNSSTGATTMNVAVSGNAMSSEPTTQPAITFGTVTTNSIVVNLTGGNGQKKLVLVKATSAVNATPVDATTYTANATFGSGSQIGTGNYVVFAGSGSSVTISGLQQGTTYHFSVFAFNDDSNAGSENYLTTSPGTANQTTSLPGPTTYTWNVASGNWSSAASWSPNRTTPAINDILVFNGATQGSSSVNVDFTTSQTIGQLKVINNANPTFTVGGSNRTLTIANNVSGTDFLVESGSHLAVTNSSANNLTIQLATGETGDVFGRVSFQGAGTFAAAHRLQAADNNSLEFENGSFFQAGTNFSGNAFGTTSLNSVWFKDGSTYVHGAGSNPFGAGTPNSVVTFATNSNYLLTTNASPSISGRTYGNMEINTSAFAQTLTGGGSFTVNDLTITSATSAGFNVTGGVIINGDLNVNAGAITFAPASASFVRFNGTGQQLIAGSGTLTFGNNAGIEVVASSDVNLKKAISLGSNLTVNGSFIADVNTTVTFNGTAARTVGGSGEISLSNITVGSSGIGLNNALKVGRLVTLTGNLTTNGNPFTLLSDATGTAMVVNNPGVVNGRATVQRYIEPAFSGRGYRHYSSPVTTATVDDLDTGNYSPIVNPAYNTAPIPGMVRPFPSIFAYDQSRLTNDSAMTQDFNFGWMSPSFLTSSLSPGHGYTVNIPASTTVDFNGPLNNGNVSTGALTRGGTTNSGWHMLGNPYPAPIDWDLASVPSGMNDAVYVFHPNGRYSGQYVSYINGVGSLTDGVIPAMQGFFVRVTSGSPTFNFTNAMRLTAYENPSFYRKAETRPLVQLNLSNASGKTDELFVYQQAGATLNDDVAFDAYKVQGNGPEVPTLYAITPNGQFLSVDGLPELTRETVIPLGVNAGVAGTYTFQAAKLLNLPSSAEVLLEDRLTGTMQNLKNNGTYTCQLAAEDNVSRFVLRFKPNSKDVAAGPVADLSQVIIFPNPTNADRGFTVSVNGLQGEKLEAQLYSQVGQLVDVRNLTVKNGMVTENFSANKLPKGVYTFKLISESYQTTKKVVIQ